MRRFAALAVALTLVVGAELSARALSPRLPPPLEWHSWEAQLKVQQMDRVGDADYVFAGTSQMDLGLQPRLFAQLNHVTAYNAALLRGTPTVMEPWLRWTVLPRLHPNVIVIGVGPLDLDDTPLLRQFSREFSRSPAEQRASHNRRLIGRLEDFCTRTSALIRERVALRQPRVVLNAARGRTVPADIGEARDLRAGGEMVTLRRRRYSSRASQLVFQLHAERGDIPSTFRLTRTAVSAARSLIHGAAASGARVVIVRMPVHPDRIAVFPHGKRDYDRELETWRSIAREVGARVFDLYPAPDNSYFADFSHLNAAGSRWFTESVARLLRQT